MLSTLLVALAVGLPGPATDARLAQAVVAAVQGAPGPRLVAREDLALAAARRPDLALAREVSAVVRDGLGPRVNGLLVTARAGVVDLGGRVREAADLYRAHDLAATVDGVSRVRNTLVTERGERLVTETGPALDAGNRPFAFVTDGLVGGGGMGVEVRDGVVTLSGVLSAAEARAEVVARVRAVEGVRALRDHLVVRAADRAADTRLLGVVHHRLATAPAAARWLADLELGVRGGLVHVAGRVPDHATRQLLELLIVSVSDTLVVASELELDPSARPSAARATRPGTSVP